MHPAISSCAALPLLRFTDVFHRMLPPQVALHLVPALVLRPRAVWRRPARVLLGAMRSAAFLGVLAVLYHPDSFSFTSFRLKRWFLRNIFGESFRKCC
jgi:hypothetical protein